MVVDIAIFKMITIFSNLGREILCGWGDRGGKAIEKLVLDRLGTRVNIIFIDIVIIFSHFNSNLLSQ